MPADFSRLLTNVKLRVPGVLDATITEELKTTLFDFFQRSVCWVEGAPFTTVNGQTDYEVTPASGDIYMLMNVTRADGTPVSAGLVQPDIVRLAFAPSTAEQLTANIALTPPANSPLDVPDWVVARYWVGLMDGVCARLMSEPAKPYTNEKFAKAHEARFLGSINMAKRDALVAYRFRGQGWSFPRGFTH